MAAILCAWLVLTSARADILPGAGGLSATGMVGGSKGESHAWVALPLSPPTEGAAIIHLPPRRAEGRADSIADAEDGSVRLALRLPRMPERLAAWDNRVWIVFEPEPIGGKRVRRVLTMSVEPGPLGGSWASPESEGRLPALPSLPGDEELAGFVGSSRGPLALLRSADPAKGYSLLMLAGAGWSPVSLSPGPMAGDAGGVPPGERLDLVAAPNGVAIVALGPERGAVWNGQFLKDGPKKPGNSPVRVLDWSRTGLSTLDAAGVQAPLPPSQMVTVAGQVVYASRRAGGATEIWNPSSGSCRLLNRLAGVGSPCALVPLDQIGRVALVWEEREKPNAPPTAADSSPTPGFKTHIVEVSAFTGAVLYDGPARVGGPVSAAELKLLALVMVGVMAIVLLVVLRPDAGAGLVSLPRGLALAEPGRRVVAGAIDLLVALIAVAWFRHVPLPQLIAPATLLYDPSGVETLLLVLGFGIVHSTLGEWLLGRSIGKLVVRCEVVRVTMATTGAEPMPVANRPGLWRAAVRNVVRWTLAPLAITGLNGPDHRHRGDLAAGTVVVIRIPIQRIDP